MTGNDALSGDGGNTWSKLTDPANGDVVLNPDGTYTYTPDAGWSGTDSFTYQICDADDDCDEATVTITVTSVDEMPVAEDDEVTTLEDTPLTASVTGNDVLSGDGGNTWSKLTDPANGGVVFNPDGSYTYTPDAGWSGTDSFTYEICDVDDDCDEATVTITVTSVDEMPVAEDDSVTTPEDTPVTASVTGNDVLSGDGGNTWSKLTDPANGDVVFNPDGSYTYTPDAGWSGTDSFTYEICDVDGDCDEATVTITVTSVDEMPVAEDDVVTTLEDTPVTGSVTGNDVLSGDGGNTWSKLTDPANGAVVFNPDGSYTYTPEAGWSGTDSFTYQICDADDDCDEATVTITVTSVDEMPVAEDDEVTTLEDTPVTDSVTGNDVLSGDGGNTWSKLTDPANGAVVFNPDGSYTYTPEAGWSGTDSFTYQICDADDDCDEATVTITVTSVDEMPVAEDDEVTTLEDTPVTGSVTGNDVLSGDGGNTWSKLTDPANGDVVFNPDGSYTYTPEAGWSGTDSFTYEICDVDGDCEEATVTITVTPVNDCPVAVDDGYDAVEDQTLTVTADLGVLVNDEDEDSSHSDCSKLRCDLRKRRNSCIERRWVLRVHACSRLLRR